MKFIITLCIISTIFTINIDAAVNYLKTHAHQSSRNQCGLYVHRALEAAGFHPYLPMSAYQYWSDGLLKKIGYKEISRPKSFQKGDITVTENNYAHPQGHMAMWIGNQWVSDFFQNSEYVYSSNQPPVHYFRYPKTVPTTPSKTEKKCNGKTINEVANEVIQGKWDSGEARKQKLTSAGCDYNTVQNEVNRILGIN